MLKRAVQQGAASEEARCTLQYVEPLNDVRPPLTGFFSRLLDSLMEKEQDWSFFVDGDDGDRQAVL